jgi:hypothetical protein
MKTNVQKMVMALSLLGMLTVLPSCGDLAILGQEIFNTNFLVDTGAKTGGAEGQITPDLAELLTLKVENQTEYPANMTINIKRAQKTETFVVTLAAGQVVGKLVENCNDATDPVLSLYVPLLGDDQSGAVLPVLQAFVTVDGLPVVVPSSQSAGVLNVRTDFNCGDTVQFVIHPSFADTDRYQISAVVFSADSTDTE